MSLPAFGYIRNLDFAEDCTCLDFDANQAHDWLPFPLEGDFYWNLNQGEFPDWLKFEESDEALHAALSVAKPQNYPFSKARKKHELEYDSDEVQPVVPIEKLPFESLLPLMNTYQFPASHKGLESIPFWIKIYARFSTSYGFYFVKVGKNKEFAVFRQKFLKSSGVWILPYWCLWKEYGIGKWFRCMILVARDMRQDWGVRIEDEYDFLKTIVAVSVPDNPILGRIRHIACPMIPHAFQWICHMMPDCYEVFQSHFWHDPACFFHDGLLICRLKIGSEGEYIDKLHPVLRKDMPSKLPITGGPFVFNVENKCFFIVKDYTERQLQDLLRITGSKIWNEGKFSDSQMI